MMIKLMETAAECDTADTWPKVVMIGILVAGVVAWLWIVNR